MRTCLSPLRKNGKASRVNPALEKQRWVFRVAMELQNLFAYVDAQPDAELAEITNEELVDRYMRDRWYFRYKRELVLKGLWKGPYP